MKALESSFSEFWPGQGCGILRPADWTIAWLLLVLSLLTAVLSLASCVITIRLHHQGQSTSCSFAFHVFPVCFP